MARKIANRISRPTNLWWITGAVVALFALCAGAAVIVRSFFFPAQPTPLPIVSTFALSTPSATVASGSPTTTSLVIQSTTTAPVFTSTLLPTPTNSSLFNWIFSNLTQNTQATSIPVRTSTPIRVVVVTLTPTVASFPAPPTQAAPSPLVCKNILYPARPGNQWTYFVNTPNRSGDINMKVATVQGTQAAVDVTDLADGSISHTFVQCDQDVVLSFPFLNAQGLIGETINGSMNVDYLAGVIAPNEAAFVASNWALSWVSQYRVYGNGVINYNGTDFNFILDPSVVNLTCQTLGPGNTSFEKIVVAAGTFNSALKVICRGDGQVTANLNGSQVSGTINAQATQWFAPNIGLLKSQSDYVYLNVFGISIPLTTKTIAGTIELKSYTVGQ